MTEKFSAIKNFNVEVPSLMDPAPFPPESQTQLVRIVPVKDMDNLVLHWTLPYSGDDIKGKPLNYFSHLFGHEGENSILSWLIAQGLALELGAGPSHKLWGFSVFEVNIKLTKKGLQNYQKVVEAVFQYAQRLRIKGP